jgi:hypothetical protein
MQYIIILHKNNKLNAVISQTSHAQRNFWITNEINTIQLSVNISFKLNANKLLYIKLKIIRLLESWYMEVSLHLFKMVAQPICIDLMAQITSSNISQMLLHAKMQ